MNLSKVVLFLATTIWSLASSGVEITPKIIGTMNADFFYSIYPGYTSEKNNDESISLMTLGISEFYLVDVNNEIKKTCRTDPQRILHAFYDKDGKYIITTASDETVDIYDAECNKLFSLTDKIDGIHMGIFGHQDGNLVVITSSKSNNNLSKVWIVPGITGSARL